LEREGEGHPILLKLESLKGEFRRVVDVGCGKGELLFRMEEKFGVRGIGVDKKPSEIYAAASKRGPSGKLSFLVQRAEELGFADGSFDVAVSSFSVHEFEDQLSGLREIFRVLGDGGTFVCLDWTKGVKVAPGQRPLSPEEMEELCREAGFEDVFVRPLDEERILCIAKKPTPSRRR